MPRPRGKLIRKREAVGSSAGRFALIFEKARKDLVEDVLRAFGALGRKEPSDTGMATRSQQYQRAVQLTRMDEAIRTSIRKVYKAIESGCDETYRSAVREAVTELELGASVEQRLNDSRLHLPTIELQRRLMEQQAREAFIKAGATAGRVVNSYYASPDMRQKIQEAVTYAQLRGGGANTAANEIIKAFNATGNWQDRQTAAAVAGKFVSVGGRNYDLAGYAELVADARYSELYNRGQVNEYVEDGYALVQVDRHFTTAEVCMPFEGTIWSITGTMIGSYPPLSQCLNGGPPFHPRCSHYLDPIDAHVAPSGRVRVSGNVYGQARYKPNEAVLAAEERIKSRIDRLPPTYSSVGYGFGQQSKRLMPTDDAGAPAPEPAADDFTKQTTRRIGTPGQLITPGRIGKFR